MCTAIAERAKRITPDQPQGRIALRVVPIIGPSHDEPRYRLLEGDALTAVKVSEISEAGSVPELLVENTLEERVFLMDGQELLGAKQNRILNTDVLVSAATKLRIPVSCVEAGRWRHTSETFMPGKAASYAVRSGKQARVHEALRAEGRHDADQSAVWEEVACSLASSGSASDTQALHDAYEARREQLAEFRGSLRMPKEAVGLAVLRGSQFQGLDLFDRHSTLKYFWESLVDSYAIDWLMAPVEESGTADLAGTAGVTELLEKAAGGKWEAFQSPGEGRDWRLDDERLTGAALVWDDRVVTHLQLFPRTSDQEQSGWRPQQARIHRRYTRPWGPVM